jgi:hypothetical protein
MEERKRNAARMMGQRLPEFNAGVGSKEAPATLHNAPRVVGMAKSHSQYASTRIADLMASRMSPPVVVHNKKPKERRADLERLD